MHMGRQPCSSLMSCHVSHVYDDSARDDHTPLLRRVIHVFGDSTCDDHTLNINFLHGFGVFLDERKPEFGTAPHQTLDAFRRRCPVVRQGHDLQ